MLTCLQKLQTVLQQTAAPKIILREQEKTLTGQALLQQAGELAAYFAEQGAQPHDRIAVQLPNSLEFVLCYFAALVGGYTIVPINSALPQSDIDYIISVTQPTLFIKQIADLAFRPCAEDCIRATPDTILAIFFTSGTTNRPKGVCHSVENMLANANAFNALVGLTEQTCLLHIMPMGYMAGFLNTVLCPLLAGGSVVIAPQFNAKEAIYFWQPAMAYHINTVWLTPTMAALLARLNRSQEVAAWTKAHLQHVFVGTAPLLPATKQLFENTFGVICLESYGMTEVMLVASNTRAHAAPSGVGRLLAGVEMQARDEQGNPLPPGKEGSLFIKTPFALMGYLDPTTRQHHSPLTADWFATGDYGYVTEQNTLCITGRIKDLIIRGGTNISPRAVEEALLQHPSVREAAVIGKAHAFWGEEVVAFLMLEDNQTLNQAALIAHCQENLHADAVPTVFKVLPEFPRASTGKIQTQKLRELV